MCACQSPESRRKKFGLLLLSRTQDTNLWIHVPGAMQGAAVQGEVRLLECTNDRSRDWTGEACVNRAQGIGRIEFDQRRFMFLTAQTTIDGVSTGNHAGVSTRSLPYSRKPKTISAARMIFHGSGRPLRFSDVVQPDRCRRPL